MVFLFFATTRCLFLYAHQTLIIVQLEVQLNDMYETILNNGAEV